MLFYISDYKISNTEQPITILGIAGSLRSNSNSTRALKIALQNASLKYSAMTRLVDLKEKALPIFNPSDRSEDNQIVKDVTKEVVKADAFILASPDYHGSMSGAIKNWLDFYWKEFAGKTFGYIVASHEKGLTVMDQMRTAVRQCYGWSLPYGISINSEEDFDDKMELTNKKLMSRLDMMARDLVVYGKLLRGQFVND